MVNGCSYISWVGAYISVCPLLFANTPFCVVVAVVTKIEGHFYNTKTLLTYINIVIIVRLEELLDTDSL